MLYDPFRYLSFLSNKGLGSFIWPNLAASDKVSVLGSYRSYLADTG